MFIFSSVSIVRGGDSMMDKEDVPLVNPMFKSLLDIMFVSGVKFHEKLCVFVASFLLYAGNCAYSSHLCVVFIFVKVK